jgi:DNA polymerase elongation subunit (family B)
LVLKLLYKLEIITNNISMANVCSVPIRYIFLRGQGIKSLSLVSKECRKKQYLIPTMRKKEDEIENESFEGAIVFEPEIGFHKSPITVLDFNSLYPSSIISKNVSHETLKHPLLNTEDITKKLNFDGFSDPKVYENVKYDDTVCTYAKYDKEFGILPNILLKLLAESLPRLCDVRVSLVSCTFYYCSRYAPAINCGRPRILNRYCDHRQILALFKPDESDGSESELDLSRTVCERG